MFRPVSLFKHLTALTLLFCQCHQSEAQVNTNRGNEYWFCFPKHTPSTSQARMLLYITADCAAAGAVTINNLTDSFYITTAGAFIEKEVPYGLAYLNEENTVTNKGIKVSASSKVSVYAHIFAGVRSEAYMALPVQMLGNTYFSCNYTQRNTNGSSSQFQVVATEPGTRVTITPRIGGVLQAPFNVDLPVAGSVYQYTSPIDLSGSEIISIPAGPGSECKNIAVFSGSSCTSILSNTCTGPDSYDPLCQQLYPTMYWGTDYLLAPFASNPAGYHVRVIAASNGTPVFFDGVQVATLDAGEVYPPEFTVPVPVQGDLTISSDRPISVAQYLMDDVCNSSTIGDPDMVMVTPATYMPSFPRNIYTSNRQSISKQYIKVVAPTMQRDSFKLNGNPVSTGWTTMNFSPSFSYNNIPMPLANQMQVMELSSSGNFFPFDAQVYGLGNAESYIYTGGYAIPVIGMGVNDKEKQLLRAEETMVGNVCFDEQFNLYVYCPFTPGEITWDPGVFGSPVTEINPVPVGNYISMGLIYFKFKLNQAFVGNTQGPGIYSFSAKIKGTFNGQCKTEFVVKMNLQVYPKPNVDFSINNSRCLKDSVLFTGINPMSCTPAGGCDQAYSCDWAKIKGWNWDFGDGASGSGQTAYHHYNAPGTYSVVLHAISETGCPVNQVVKFVTIDTLPTAGFRATAPYCEKQNIHFTDSSRFYNLTDTLKDWYWDFGDGSQLIRHDSSAFDYMYADTGTYTVTLQVKNKFGCLSDSFSRQIRVNATPKVNFGFTPACANDPFVQFTDSSSIKDHTELQFSYLWNFGDPAATPSNPGTATVKDPRHQYTIAGTFPVSLQVTSSQGCVFKKDTVIIISSAAVAVAWNINSANNFCSDNPVLLTNLSAITTGSINKLFIYWNALADINDVTIDPQPAPGKTYLHQYPLFNNAPPVMNYNIKVVAQSGQTCLSSLEREIVMNAIPVAAIKNIKSVCSDTNQVIIDQGYETTGLPGTGTYFGTGISAGGLFNIQQSGAGNFPFGYAFKSVAGCRDTAYANLQVFQSPVVDAGPDINLPEELSYTFSPITAGNAVSFLWTPSTYLNDVFLKNATVVKPKDDILYQLRVSSPEGCSASDSVFVKVIKNILIPNTFTPNNDGINDTWIIENLIRYTGCRVQVFNRYGQKLFESHGYNNPWDGTFKGKSLPFGTYYYVIELNNGKRGFTGYVTIIK